MIEFPSEPMAPKQFMEEFLPKAMAEGLFAEVPEGVDVLLGVTLEGEDGGEWVIRLAGGEVSIREGSREEAALTIVQTVEDWRGALWEGRGGVFGAQATALFSGASPAEGSRGGVAAPGAAVPNAAAIQQMASLDGLIRIVVKGEGRGDWATGFKLGPGAIPEEPRTQILVTEEDAEAMKADIGSSVPACMA
ncbi:MAG TPA: hypothetical protein ENO23_01730, partial [Alphaproteobacteria bacterium]|nr:hypothetical protein [Alphaproteobacteria bacterium]